MKKISMLKAILVAFFYMASFGFKAGATTITITVTNFTFQDAPANVTVGDVLHFVRGTGNHTTTSTSVPAGAAAWDAPINAGNTTFDYQVLVAGTYNYKCTPHAAGGMVSSFTASSPLPVKLSEFKVFNESNSAVLKWTTASEDNIDYFSVQKSNTGADFAEIGRVPAAGHSSVLKSYNYTDRTSSPADKYYYYAIAAVDKQGKKEFSSVELFRNKTTISKLIISLSPNPINRAGHLMLKFNADKPGKMDVKVLDMEGRSVMETTMQASEGVNNGHLMFDNIASGSYSVSFELNGVKEVHKLIVK